MNSVNIGFVVTPQWENIRSRRAPDLPADVVREDVEKVEDRLRAPGAREVSIDALRRALFA